MYLNGAVAIADELVALQTSNRWEYSSDDASVYTSFGEGAAGIVYFLLKMFELTRDAAYSTAAQNGLTWLTNEQTIGNYWCEEEGESATTDSFTGYYKGTAGIADVFVSAYDILGTAGYLTVAQNAASHLIGLYSNNFPSTPVIGDTDVYIDIDVGIAGIWDFLSHLSMFSLNDDTYIDAIIESVDNLFNVLPVLGTSTTRYWNYYYSQSTGWDSQTSLSYKEGMAGMLEVLSGILPLLGQDLDLSNIYQEFTKAKTYLAQNSQMISNTSGILYGRQGVASVLGNLPILVKPSYTGLDPSSSPNLSYTDNLEISLTPRSLESAINSVELVYRVNSSDLTRTRFNVSGSQYISKLSDSYRYYNSLVEYYIVIKDLNNMSYIITNAGSFFSYQVSDEIKPVIYDIEFTNTEGGEGILYGRNGGGRLEVEIYEPKYSSGVASAEVTFDIPSIGIISQNLSHVVGSTHRYYCTVDGEYADQFLISNVDIDFEITVEDFAGNIQTYTNQTTVVDQIAPTLYNYITRSLGQVNNNDQVQIKINITDDVISGGSGVKNATIYYSTNRNLDPDDWNKVPMVNDTSGYYFGYIPEQDADQTVYYYVVIYDVMGNGVAIGNYNQDGVYFTSNPSEIPLVLSFYEVVTNWGRIATITAIIVGIVVASFLIYRYRGSYLDRMRRDASMSARAISIKESILGVYYKIADKLNIWGDKATRYFQQSTLRERISDWSEDNLESPLVRLLSGITTFIKTYLKFALAIIVGPFILLWRVITKSSGKKLLLGALLGLILIVASVVKFFGESFYPMRAMFFIDLGFVLFIGSFVVIILHLVYNIFSK